jgi:hypothetical protein
LEPAIFQKFRDFGDERRGFPQWRAKSSRNAERDQIGMMGDIIPDSRATSPGIRTCMCGF